MSIEATAAAAAQPVHITPSQVKADHGGNHGLPQGANISSPPATPPAGSGAAGSHGLVDVSV